MPPLLPYTHVQAIDKRNQNIIRSVLESAPPANVSEAEQKVRREAVSLQARTFYHSCMRERESSAPEDLLTLQAVVEFAGGWQLSGQQNTSMDLTERLYRLQNQLGGTRPSTVPRGERALHMGGHRRERHHPHRGGAGRVDGGPAGGAQHLPEGGR